MFQFGGAKPPQLPRGNGTAPNLPSGSATAMISKILLNVYRYFAKDYHAYLEEKKEN